MSSYTKRAVKGSIVVLVMNILAAFAAYITRLVLARSLTVSEFGLFYAVFSLIGFLIVFKDVGMGQAMIRFIPQLEVKKKRSNIKSYINTASVIQLVSSGIIAIILIIVSRFLAENYFHSPKAKWVLIILAIGYWISSLDNLIGLIFQGFKRFFIYSLHNFLRNVIILVLVIIFLFLGYNVFAPCLANLFVYVMTIIIFGFVLVKFVFKDYFQYRFRTSFKIFKKLLWFGIPAMFMCLGQYLIVYTDTLTITYFMDLEAVALYNVAVPIITLVLYLAVSLGAVLIPFSSELWAKKQAGSLKYGIRLVHKYALAIIIPLGLSIIVFPEIVINVFFGQNYLAAASALQILSAGVIIYTIAYLNVSILIAIGRPRTNMRIMLTAAILNLILNVVLIQIFGILGAALATCISYLMILILSSLYLHKLIKFSFNIIGLVKFFLGGIAFLTTIMILKQYLALHYLLELTVCISAGIIIYVTLVLLLKAIDIDEIRGLKKQFFEKIR